MADPPHSLEYRSTWAVDPKPRRRRPVHWADDMHLWGPGGVVSLIGVLFLAHTLYSQLWPSLVASLFFFALASPFFLLWRRKRARR